MKKTKLLSVIISSALLFSTFVLGGLNNINADEVVIFNETFENNITNWMGRGAAKAEITSQISHQGNNSLYISGRTASWNGAYVENASIKAGGTYTFGVWVMYDGDSYSNSHSFSLSMQYDLNGEIAYPEIASGVVTKGKWQYIEGTVEIPSSASNIIPYVQTVYTTSPTEQDLMNFYVDDITCNQVSEQSQSTTKINYSGVYGDLNDDKKVNNADLVILSQHLIGDSNLSQNTLIYADITNDGKVDVADLALMKQYLMGDSVILGKVIVTTTEATTTTTTTPIVTTQTTTQQQPTVTAPASPMQISANELPIFQKSLTSMGNTYRVIKSMEKAKSGQQVSIAYLGGSITEGYNATASNCYSKLSFDYFAKTFGTGSNVKYVNAGLSGTPSVLGNLRAERDILYSKPDVIFIEFAVNDSKNLLHQVSFESLVRKCLSQPNEPAVILVFTRSQTGYSCQDQMQKIGQKYNLPMISVNDAITSAISGGKMTWGDYASDQYHPSVSGHLLVSRFIQYFYEQSLISSTRYSSYTIPSDTAYGMDYVNATLADSSTMNIQSLGAFKNGTSNSKFPNGFTLKNDGSTTPLKFTAKTKAIFVVFKSNSSGMGSVDVKINGSKVSTVNGVTSGGWGGPDVVLAYSQNTASEMTVEISPVNGYSSFEILGIGISQ